MDRKEFFKHLILGLAGISLVNHLHAKTKSKVIILSHPLVAGFHYYDGYKTEQYLNVDDELRLFRQPDNPYDKNAIEVYHGNAKLGYIPRRQNKIIVRMMDQGIEIKSRIVNVYLSRPSYERVRIEVYMES